MKTSDFWISLYYIHIFMFILWDIMGGGNLKNKREFGFYCTRLFVSVIYGDQS